MKNYIKLYELSLNDYDSLLKNYKFKIFESKIVSEDLDIFIINFIYRMIGISDEFFYIPKYLENYIADFGDNKDMPENFLRYLSKFYSKNIDKDTPRIYKIIKYESEEKRLEFFLNMSSLFKKLRSKSLKVSYEMPQIY